MHGLRSGCAISLAMSGVDLQTVMDHVGWKTSNTTRHYLRMEQVLKSGGAGDSLAELPLDLVELYRKKMNSQASHELLKWSSGIRETFNSTSDR